MATNDEHVEFQRSAGALKPVAFPSFPPIPDAIKNKFPDLMPHWKSYERDSDQFRIKLQNILRFGGASAAVQPVVQPPVVFPPIPPGPQGGAQGSQGFQGKIGEEGPQGVPGETIILTPPVSMDDEALVLATVGV